MYNIVEHADAVVCLITNISHYNIFSGYFTKRLPMRVLIKCSPEMRQDNISSEQMQKKGMIVLIGQRGWGCY